MKQEFTLDNNRHYASGTYQGTWSGKKVYVTKTMTLSVSREPRGINVPVTVIVTTNQITVHTH